MSELKPCPFCGTEPEVISDFYGCLIYKCNQCDYELYPTQWVNRHESAEMERELLNFREFGAKLVSLTTEGKKTFRPYNPWEDDDD